MVKEKELTLDEKVKKENRSVVQYSSRATKLVDIKSDEDLTKAAEFLVQVKKKLKEYETERTSYTKPINQSLTKINTKFKEITNPLKTAETEVKKAILEYRGKKEQQRLIDEAKLQKENGDTNITIADRVPDIVESKSGEIRTRKVWTFKVEDIKKVPRDYLVLDEKKVKEEIKEGKRKIKGLEIFQEETLSTYGA